MRFSVIYWITSVAFLFAAENAIAAVVGIDYGQQFLKAMVVSPQAPMELILTPESKRKDSSGLAIRKFGSGSDDIERFFGSSVGSIATRFPKDTLLHLKPLLGKAGGDMNDITLYLKEHPGVKIVETDRNTLAFEVHGIEYSIEELVAMNLQEIVNRGNLLLKEKDPSGFDSVDRLSITVPEYFDQHQRKALLDVGVITADSLQTCLVGDGLSVIINFAFKTRDFPPGEKQFYVVYDMGGGSTKASLFSILQPLNNTEPLTLEFGGYGFNDRLGGSKFTLDVANLIENKFLEEHKAIRTNSLHANSKALAKIIQAAEKAKLVLSANSEAFVSIESLFDEIDFKTTISRSEFEDFIQESFSEIVGPIEDALRSQLWGDSVSLENISGIVLTGGSSRVPVVQEELSKLLSEDRILRSVNADEAAVNGATIRGIKIFDAFKTKPFNVVERSIYDYGMKVQAEDVEEIVFPKGSEYPIQKTINIKSPENITNKFTLDLYEHDRLFKTVTVYSKDVDKKSKSKACLSDVTYSVTFSLSQNRLFDIDKVEEICQNTFSKTDLAPENEKETGSERAEISNSNGKQNRAIKLTTSKVDIPIKHMSLDEKYRVRKHISFLVETDAERYAFEAAKNSLEGLLYETREYLETATIIEKGPKLHLEQLAEMIPDYLEWLEDDANSSKKVDIEEKIAAIRTLRNKIATYMEFLTEPLDGEQFEDMIKRAAGLSQNLTSSEENVNDTLKLIQYKFTEFNINVQEEFAKISLPSSISKLLARWDETLANIEKNTDVIERSLREGLLEDMNRETLLEMKLAFDDALMEFEKKINAFNMAKDYRFRELLSMAQRLEKAKKRKEDRLKKSMSESNISTSIIPSDVSKSLKPSSFSETIFTEDLKASTSIFHDEL